MSTIDEAPEVYSIEFKTKNKGKAGQFYMLSVPGVGEAPISVASGSGRRLVFTIRSIGTVSARMKGSESVGLRGPYGTFWPWKDNDEIVAVAGGIGVPPIRSLIEEIEDSKMTERLEVLYGARSPSDIVYKNQFKEWKKDLDIHITVDKGDSEWKGSVGFVPSLLKDSHFSKNAALFVIGPPLMMMNTVKEALKLGYKDDRIFLSLERRMECGIGVCGHCNVGQYYACESGPIFNYSIVKGEQELFL